MFSWLNIEVNDLLNENKIKMMTKMAIYEKNDGKKMLKTAKYFKNDYVTLEILKTLVSTTMAYLVIVALYSLCKVDLLVVNMNTFDYAAMSKTVAGYYVALLVIFGIIAGLVYSRRFEQSRKDLKKYFSRLNKLERFYNGQKKKK